MTLMATITITATVDDSDLAAFLKADPDIHGSMRARLSEVFGEDGAILTTVDVREVFTAPDGADEACAHEAIICTECGSEAY